MMLYDVFYHDNAMDSDVVLPEPKPDIRYAKNTNWDGHVMHISRTLHGTYEWVKSGEPISKA